MLSLPPLSRKRKMQSISQKQVPLFVITHLAIVEEPVEPGGGI